MSAFTADAVRGKDLLIEILTPDHLHAPFSLTLRDLTLTGVGASKTTPGSIDVALAAQRASFTYDLTYA